MKYYVIDSGYNNFAIIYTEEKDAKQTNKPYFQIESLPSGIGVLKTDGKKIWRDQIEYKKEPDVLTLLKAQLKAQTERSDFIEDCIAEMAGVVYNTEETT